MKKVHLILISLVFWANTLSSYAQKFYYSGGKKVEVSVDSTCITTKLNKTKLKALKKEIDTSKFYRIHNFKNNELLEFKAKKKNIKNLTKKLKTNKYSFGYKIKENPIWLTGEIVLRPKNNVTVDTIIKFTNNEIFVIQKTKQNIYKMGVNNWDSLFTLANRIYESGLVKYSHPNFYAIIEKFQNDLLYPDQYYLNNTGQSGGTPGIDINAPEAWNLSRGINRVRIAVIDDGVEAHPDLLGRVVQGFTPSDPNGFGAPTATPPPAAFGTVGHGQACAGIIGATHNNRDIAGISGCSDIIPINIFNDWFTVFDPWGFPSGISYRETGFDIALGINTAWDDLNADILSNSWGYTNVTGPGNPLEVDAIEDAIEDARTLGRNGNGCVVIFASGNSAENFDGVTFPANLPGVVTVGAINHNGNIWNYSSRGAGMDLVAPSGDVNLLGDVVTIDRVGANGYSPLDHITNFGGTSAACPQVAGVAALMLAVDDELTENEIVSILRNTATDLGIPGFDNTYGFGLLNARSALQAVFDMHTISGPSFVCSSNTTFTIDRFPGSTISWTRSDNLDYVSGQGGNNYVVKAKFRANGEGWVRAHMTNYFCDDITVTKTFWVGPPNRPSNLTFYPYSPCLNQWVIATVQANNPTMANAHYNWRNTHTYYDQNPSGSEVQFKTLPNYPYSTNVYVRGTNVCGSSTEYSETLYVNDCSGGLPASPRVAVYPNPAQSEVQITIEEKDKEKDLVKNIEIVDNTGIKVFKKAFKTNNLTINVTNWKKGIYFINLYDNDEILRSILVVD